jgi:hypothetical protein
MTDEHDQIDPRLALLAQSLRSGDHMLACLQLAELALRLDRCIQREERVLSLTCALQDSPSPIPLAKIRAEHASLRHLVSSIANALDRADDRRCLELVGKLRSVLLLHLMKEERLGGRLAPLTASARARTA